jgi:hypothetical protein
VPYHFIKKILFLIVFSSFLFLNASFSQRIRATFGLGACSYIGDLQKREELLVQPSTAFSVGAMYNLNNYCKARVDFSLLTVRGDDKVNSSAFYTRARNLNFRSTVWELAFLAELDFVNLFLKQETLFTPYIFLGPSILHFNPTTIDRNGNKVRLHNVGTEGQLLGNPAYENRKYNLLQLNLQGGAGIRYAINNKVTLGVETSIRRLNTDYIDDIHTPSYVNPAEFLAKGQIVAAQLQHRGDELGYGFNYAQSGARGTGIGYDFYYTIEVKATFRLDNIHLGGDLDYYGSSQRRAKRSVRNPNF